MRLRLQKKYLSILLVLFAVGCSTIAIHSFDRLYGSASTQDRLESLDSDSGQYYIQEVKPVLEQRCVVCHACYDAPCQLKLSSPAGIDRGMHHDKVYNATRLTAAEPTRLYIDEKNTLAWRNRGFRPVLNERIQTAEANTEAGVMYQALQLKTRQADYTETLLDNDQYDFSLDADRTCPSIEDYQSYAQENPQNGMPYGMPKLAAAELETLNSWLASGAKMSDDLTRHYAQQAQVDHWEAWFNNDDIKSQLVARYIYEHVYYFHLYFDAGDNRQPAYFRLIRSSTPIGEPANEISALRPYDDPKLDRVYYRLVPELESISSKTHIPYLLDDERAQHWKTWFIDTEYTVSKLPSYIPSEAGNPFIAFQELPINSRYNFLLDDAEAYIMGFMKGPVCRGQVALNVIRDHFWVFFLDPKAIDEDLYNAFLAENKNHMRLPTTEQSTVLPLSTWRRYSKLNHQYAIARSKILSDTIDQGAKLTLNRIWDGEGSDDNVALTIIRHFDSASVVKGTIGSEPKTIWIMDYSLLERIHYLLVAGFDPYGNMGHQLVTRLYMDFLRFEGEFNFASFLPADQRYNVLSSWYQGADKAIFSYMKDYPNESHFPTAMHYDDNSPVKSQLVAKLLEHVKAANSTQHELNEDEPEAVKDWVSSISGWKGGQVRYLPQMVFIEYSSEGEPSRYYTLLRHNEHSNITSLFSEASNRLPAEDYISVQKGLVGAYPSAFWSVDQDSLPQLIKMMMDLKSEEDYRHLMDRFGMRRTNQQFWDFSDRLHEHQMQNKPIEASLMDYNRLENR